MGQLLEKLEQLDAANWHATEQRGLFSCAPRELEDVTNLVVSSRSHGLGTGGLLAQLKTEEMKDQWADIQRNFPHMKAWTKNNPYAMALVRFLLLAHVTIHEQVSLGSLNVSRVLFLCDRQDWLKPRKDAKQPVSGFVRMPLYFAEALQTATPEFDVWVCVDKTASASQQHLSLLGLVDAEAWAFGRLLSAPLPGGSLHERLSASAATRVEGELFTTREVADAERHLPTGAASYLSRVMMRAWPEGRFHVLANRSE